MRSSDFVFKSKKLCITNDGKEVPKYQFVVSVSKQCDMYCYNEKKQEYHIVALYEKYIINHIYYLLQHDHKRIQEELDKGTLYRYLRELDRRASDIVSRQVERWSKTDEELIAAHNSGDIQTEGRILNCLELMAEEVMYPCVIYA